MPTIALDLAEQRFIEQMRRAPERSAHFAAAGFAFGTLGVLLIAAVEVPAALRGERAEWHKTIGFLLAIEAFLYSSWQHARQRHLVGRIFRKLL